MSNTIDQYREAKSSYLRLRNQAKKELISRFNELAGELMQIQRELLEDFGEKIAIPAKFKKVRTAGISKLAAKISPPEEDPAPPSPKVLSIQKNIERQKKRVADAHAAGKPTKALEDRLYELDDELRLAQTK